MFRSIPIGANAPDEVNVIIEITANSDPIKYEVDKDTGALFVDRFMSTSMRYPCDYGYIPGTLSEDGDPIDVMILCPQPLMPGSVITIRPIGILQMTDESGRDNKILGVPIDKLTSQYSEIKSPKDVHPLTLTRIAHFFAHYKDLEANKWVKIESWGGPDDAKHEIIRSINRAQDSI